MKRLLALILCLLLALSCATMATAEEKTSLRMVLVTNSNYNTDSWDIFNEIGNRLNIDLQIEWIASEGQKEKISTLLASNNLPDLFSPAMDVEALVNEGAIIALDGYLDKIPNYARFITDELAPYARSAMDGNMYQIFHYTDYKPAYAMVLRMDWMDNLGIEKVPETIDEWIEVWKAIRDGDPNQDGDTNDEIPLIDPPTFTNLKNGHSLLLLYGIKSNGVFYYDDEGTYSLVYSHPRYGEYLELSRMLYREKLLDMELFTHTATDVATLFNSDIAASGYQWISRPQNTTKTLGETNPKTLLSPVPPIKGPDGDQLIPHRNPVGSSGLFVIGYQVENDQKKLDALLRLIDYMYSDEGIFLMNWGIEGVHHNLVDGEPVLIDEILNDSTFTAARHAGLIHQQFPGVWTQENYNQILTKNLPAEELPIWDQQMIKGTEMYWDYYFTMPPTLSTEAWATYNADIIAKIEELRASCITGGISVEDFFKGYEALKPYGLQEILDEAQAAYDTIMK